MTQICKHTWNSTLLSYIYMHSVKYIHCLKKQCHNRILITSSEIPKEYYKLSICKVWESKICTLLTIWILSIPHWFAYIREVRAQKNILYTPSSLPPSDLLKWMALRVPWHWRLVDCREPSSISLFTGEGPLRHSDPVTAPRESYASLLQGPFVLTSC